MKQTIYLSKNNLVDVNLTTNSHDSSVLKVHSDNLEKKVKRTTRTMKLIDNVVIPQDKSKLRHKGISFVSARAGSKKGVKVTSTISYLFDYGYGGGKFNNKLDLNTVV